ncbi:lysophospholipid acyltransferase family protein [Marinimicrobium sp. ABcell2]|uniref:lysophospholipid acyltransferase family protein n=1 Tax=Marinimicrobium sp. ABcell2 TaxID=3069751 RepID=UPI0027B495F1|nr:lysophospholipid acyltransferase family protein [Marinimicrobium sp. ABcell2]MDQ2077800.1 lysophospholipid acyltransferase family protein [Marinimicrobium sp. ABcell2]
MSRVSRPLKLLFFVLLVRPLVLIVLGLNIVNRNKLPTQGPAIIAANHNSHLDTMVLMSLMPLRVLHKVRPVAAADYFLKNRWRAWFSLNAIGIIPLARRGRMDRETLFEGCRSALANGDILILFPEGSRGKAEQMQPLKRGLFHLASAEPDVPVIPVVMHGLGRALPKGDPILVPFNCDVAIGDPLPLSEDGKEFITAVEEAFQRQLNECLTWGNTGA